jgi:hypothetical protein
VSSVKKFDTKMQESSAKFRADPLGTIFKPDVKDLNRKQEEYQSRVDPEL